MLSGKERTVTALSYTAFSKKQLDVLSWWLPQRETSKFDGIICDGAVRSGKTLCMSVSFVTWAMYCTDGGSFAVCGKTIRSVKRNVAAPLLAILRDLGFEVQEKLSSNLFRVSALGRTNTFYLFGGKDESSAALIQGMTLWGVLFDEAALMPRTFIEQALARCSKDNAKLWFNCNPEYPQHWFCREWVMKTAEKNMYYLHFLMEDNPSLSAKVLKRYRTLYSGSFYDRFVLGKWCATDGLVYPFMSDEAMAADAPAGDAEEYAVSCDYGTVNPSSFGLWGLYDGVWYRLREYYYSSRREGSSRTDEEHYQGLRELIGGRSVARVIVDPSAASFIEVIRRHGEYNVVPAVNSVRDGIRKTFTALKEGRVKICRECKDALTEFGLYRWDSSGRDLPVKENDHAMDDIRYFVSSLKEEDEGIIAFAVL